MAHGILGNRFSERFNEKGPAWHRLGETFDKDLKLVASEIAARVAGDVVVESRPLHYYTSAGKLIALDKHCVIVRCPTQDDPQERIFGVSNEGWKQVNYVKLCRAALDELSKKYPVETAGVLDEGAMFFLSMRGPDFSVKGDQMEDYFIANLSNMVGVAHKIMAAPQRVVCRNTNLLAASKATISLAIPHGESAESRIALAATLVARFKELTGKVQETFNMLAGYMVTQPQLDRILTAAYPEPNVPTEVKLFREALTSNEEGMLKQVLGEKFTRIVKAQEDYEKSRKRVSDIRETARERFEMFDPSHLRGTAWAAYNAVTEVSDWREGRGAEQSSVWGSRAQEKTRAYSEAMAVATGN